MRITIDSTSKVVELIVDGHAVRARIWEGHTDNGIPVHCYITLIATPNPRPQVEAQFRRELEEQRAPSAEIVAIPLRLIL